MSPFLETIRIEEGRPLRLKLHEERMERTRRGAIGPVPPAASTASANSAGNTGFSMPMVVTLTDFISRLTLPPAGIHKLRILYKDRIESHEIIPYVPRRIKSLRLVYDDSIDYRFKSSDRSALELLLSQRDGCDEILIVQKGCITDTSFTNVAFLRQDRWFTPDTTLLDGVMRRDLLERGLLIEARITPADLPLFEKTALINAMLDPGLITVSMDRILK